MATPNLDRWRPNAAGCKLWTGYINSTGYAKAYVGRGDPRGGADGMAYVHRLIYEAAHGPLPAGWEPDHTCRVRACIALDHLEGVPKKTNIRRGVRVKLTEADAAAIRSALTLGVRVKDVAGAFGVAPGTVSNIKAGRLWR